MRGKITRHYASKIASRAQYASEMAKSRKLITGEGQTKGLTPILTLKDQMSRYEKIQNRDDELK